MRMWKENTEITPPQKVKYIFSVTLCILLCYKMVVLSAFMQQRNTLIRSQSLS